MSTSKEAKIDFAKMVINHPAMDAVMEDVHMHLFQRFRTANDDERRIITDIMEAGDLFLKELRVIIGESTEADPDENKIEKV